MKLRKAILGLSILVLTDVGLQGMFKLRLLQTLFIRVPAFYTMIQSCCLFCAAILLFILFEKQ